MVRFVTSLSPFCSMPKRCVLSCLSFSRESSFFNLFKWEDPFEVNFDYSSFVFSSHVEQLQSVARPMILVDLQNMPLKAFGAAKVVAYETGLKVGSTILPKFLNGKRINALTISLNEKSLWRFSFEFCATKTKSMYWLWGSFEGNCCRFDLPLGIF